MSLRSNPGLKFGNAFGVIYLYDKLKAVTTEELIIVEVEKLPEALQREVYEFARFLREKSDAKFNELLLSHSTLSKDWDTPEENAAWASL